MQHLFAAFGLNGPDLLAQAVNFGVLLVALWFFLYKPVMKVLAERQQKVAQGVLDAERAAEKLEKADDEAASVVAKAETDAEGIVAGARQTATEEKARLVKEAEARAAAIESDAAARAQETAAKALRESEKEVARLAVLAAEKVLRDKHSAHTA